MPRVLFVGQQPESVDFTSHMLPPGMNADEEPDSYRGRKPDDTRFGSSDSFAGCAFGYMPSALSPFPVCNRDIVHDKSPVREPQIASEKQRFFLAPENQVGAEFL
jgi:hypothetical protein